MENSTTRCRSQVTEKLLTTRSTSRDDAACTSFVGLAISQEDIAPGEMLGHRLSGGGGYGDPHERESERVRDDVLSGFVSLARARETTGSRSSTGPVDDSLAVDEAETARLRGG